MAAHVHAVDPPCVLEPEALGTRRLPWLPREIPPRLPERIRVRLEPKAELQVGVRSAGRHQCRHRPGHLRQLWHSARQDLALGCIDGIITTSWTANGRTMKRWSPRRLAWVTLLVRVPLAAARVLGGCEKPSLLPPMLQTVQLDSYLRDGPRPFNELLQWRFPVGSPEAELVNELR